MKIEDYYYHCINKDLSDEKALYDIFQKILESNALLSRNKSGFIDKKIPLNGDNYISLAYYQPILKYKVPAMELIDFTKSNMNKIFKNYEDYLNYVTQDRYISSPLTKEQFFSRNNTSDKREYFRYLDSVNRLFPIDLKWLFKNESKNDKILQYIYKKSTVKQNISDIGYYFTNDNAFDLVILNNMSIIFIISKEIPIQKTILIPNLPENFFDKDMEQEMVNSIDKRYSNLIGEVQVRDRIALEFVKGIIINDKLNSEIIKSILKKCNKEIPIMKFNMNKGIIEKVG